MKYVSDDGKKIFSTEQECLDYEKDVIKQLEEKKIKEEVRQKKISTINERYKELLSLVNEYSKEYNTGKYLRFMSPYDFIDMLCN